MAFNDRNKPVTSLRMPQIQHMKEINRPGVNPATSTFPAGSNARIKNVGKKIGRRGY